LQRGVTNIIRKLMDKYIPPAIRDSRWFMYPFFWYWFKGKNITLYMDFKTIAYSLTEKEFADCYINLDCRATDRPTDLNDSCIQYMLQKISPDNGSLLDVGCGRGYWLKLLQQEKNTLQLTGCDVFESLDIPGVDYLKGDITHLPFQDKSFDIVTCHHTIEHIRDICKAITELKRVARKQIIIVTPKQRYYYYTLDLHLHFYWTEGELTRLADLSTFECKELNGDWCYTGIL
jgi:ubiquinone/menaquinone biosynthesis C-methylase UbiE